MENIKIRDIKFKYPLLFEEACLQAEAQGKPSLRGEFSQDKQIIDCFTWNRTAQGDIFWDEVWLGDMEEAEKMEPGLFLQNKVITNVEGIKSLLISDKGLWDKNQ